MHFLLTNDDGIEAPGLAALEKTVRSLPGAQVTVVAPASERSLCGHRLTTHDPIFVTSKGKGRHAISGTPADCVRVALFALGLRPDFVLSGVNAGGNMGQDLPVSGTVAAVREAAYHGVPAIAFSHYLIRSRPLDWHRTTSWAKQVLEELLAAQLGDGEFWNVNFPHLLPGENVLPSRVHVPPCREPLKVSFAQALDEGGDLVLKYDAPYSERPATAGTDVAVCFGGQISVSKIKL